MSQWFRSEIYHWYRNGGDPNVALCGEDITHMEDREADEHDLMCAECFYIHYDDNDPAEEEADA